MDNNATNNTPHDTAANEAAAVTASNDTAASTGSGSTAVRPSHSLKQHRQPDPHRMLRQWLNIIFMIGAIIGMAIFYFVEPTVGTIIILTAMVFKMAECAFRFFG